MSSSPPRHSQTPDVPFHKERAQRRGPLSRPRGRWASPLCEARSFKTEVPTFLPPLREGASAVPRASPNPVAAAMQEPPGRSCWHDLFAVSRITDSCLPHKKGERSDAGQSRDFKALRQVRHMNPALSRLKSPRSLPRPSRRSERCDAGQSHNFAAVRQVRHAKPAPSRLKPLRSFRQESFLCPSRRSERSDATRQELLA
jgi:hypothetical protein